MPKVIIHVLPKPTILDAQGRTVQNALHSLGFGGVENVRIGRSIELNLPESFTAETATQAVATMCDKLLANPVTEDYRIEVAA
ncbi:MAG: phosphoribosylformylglycinamidine synthase subunit PurS [Armatimonadetes bacterium]|nr:phosphoribosylformylglycinamidine synthase subunit PurS [Armatimonadota bacterium]